MQQIIVNTEEAPRAIGPYVQARKVGPFLFTSGQIALDPKSGELVGDDVATQCRLALKNLGAVVNAAGLRLTDVVKTTVFLKDMGDFATVNGLYAEFFGDHKPARSCIEAAGLPKGALIEIECIAHGG